MTATAVRGRLFSFGLAALERLTVPGDHSQEAEFLRTNGSAVQNAPASLDRYLAGPDQEDEPLVRLAHELRLNHVEILVTALAASVETDLMCGRVIAHLQAPLGGSRPTIGLLAAALGPYSKDRNSIAEILTGRAVESGLLQISSEGAPLAERPVSVPIPICLALQTANAVEAQWSGAGFNTNGGAAGAHGISLPPSILAGARKQATGLQARVQRTLAVRSGSVTEAKAAASEIARLMGCGTLFIEAGKGNPVPAGVGPWLLLTARVPVFCFELGPGERKLLPALPHYRGPQLAICGPDGSIESDGETVPGWTLAVAPKAERAHLWELAVGSSSLASGLSSHRYGSGRIAQLGRLARHQGLLEGRAEPLIQDVLAASWTAEGSGLESLAQALPEPIPDNALVMTAGLREELNRLLLRCRGREGLADKLGASASAKYRPGFRALFTGPSGTGKTLASGWLATRLGLPLYRVDLAAVTSKYIGETEKNLAQLLARAEHSEVILLFDEADSMFGKRTEVKESNDRFANAQTNYLLQRIESFDGIVFLTSNNRSRFDPAFFRRLDAIVDFPVPGPMERRLLWQSHLGNDHTLSQRELNQLSASADLLGGSIRNAVFTAAVLARSEGRKIEFSDILQALADEYRKLSRQVPTELIRSA